jgi:hypothetical protein
LEFNPWSFGRRIFGQIFAEKEALSKVKFFVFWTGVCTEGLLLVSQALYHLSHAPALFDLVYFFSDRFSCFFFPRVDFR